jgi:hypothetical protein
MGVELGPCQRVTWSNPYCNCCGRLNLPPASLNAADLPCVWRKISFERAQVTLSSLAPDGLRRNPGTPPKAVARVDFIIVSSTIVKIMAAGYTSLDCRHSEPNFNTEL